VGQVRSPPVRGTEHFVLSLFGHPLPFDVEVQLVAALRADGSVLAIAAADRIDSIASTEFAAITLTDRQREAVLTVLSALGDDAPPLLLELRRLVLPRDAAQ
jgi:hypothetical protein